jgi:hypothetical protein
MVSATMRAKASVCSSRSFLAPPDRPVAPAIGRAAGPFATGCRKGRGRWQNPSNQPLLAAWCEFLTSMRPEFIPSDRGDFLGRQLMNRCSWVVESLQTHSEQRAAKPPQTNSRLFCVGRGASDITSFALERSLCFLTPKIHCKSLRGRAATPTRTSLAPFQRGLLSSSSGWPNWTLRKPVAIPERNAIQFCNAQTQQIRVEARRCDIERLCTPRL